MSNQEPPLRMPPFSGLDTGGEGRVTLESRLIDAVQQAVIATDLDGRVIYWNLYATKMFGWTREEALGRPIFELTPHETSRAEAAAIMERLTRGERWAGEFPVQRKDGSAFTAFVVDSPILDANGALAGVVGVSTDVSEVRALEGQLRQAQKMEAVGRLAGGIAHDFNNLLTVILGNIELVLQGRPHDEAEALALSGAREAATRAAQLTRQMLAFSRRQPLRPRVLDLAAALRSLEPMLRRLIPEHVDLDLEIEGTALLTVMDPGQFDQLVINLAVNARDAMPDGGRLRLQLRPASPTPEASAARTVCLTVSDTGTGIGADVLPHIFEPFFTTKEPGRGTGLGLATVYSIVGQAGGHVDVESRVGEGTTFVVTLPEASALPADVVPVGPVALGMQTRHGVLVVEDDPQLRELIVRVLGAAGFRTLHAGSAAEALDVLSRQGEDVDVLLTDLVMPGATGAALAEQVALLRPDIRILVMTGHAAPDLVERAESHARLRVLEKPFGPADLVQAVRLALASRAHVTGAAGR